MDYSGGGGGAAAAAGAGAIFMIIYLAILVLAIVSMWIIFNKADKPGWASIVPIYNLMVLAEIGGKEAWWGLLMLVPVINIVASIMICLGIAENFGKSAGFGIGLFFLGIIFFPILAFTDAEYQGGVSAPPVQRVP